MTPELALICTGDIEAVVSVFPVTAGRIELPGVGQLSPPQAGWQGDGYRIAAIGPAEIPSGKRPISTGADGVELIAGVPTWILEDEPPAPRRQVLKAVVEQRLIEAGLMDAAFAALSSSGVLFARWYSRISDSVFFDDPDALALLDVIGADPEVIMAP
ncbi:hypothetical protein [Kaistia sp. UC242_56]|uniref:hypothetical protein n=1 Tax=Kaistia sp. UC242_56 TaxID=3374625 RepID=UPI0037887DFA